MKKKNYFVLPNDLLKADLSHNEFIVLAYLYSLHSNIKSGNGNKFIRVRQRTIADACGIKTTQTISRVTQALKQKGYISAIISSYRADRLIGTYSYILNTSAINKERYTLINRSVFCLGLNAKQLKVYLFIISCMNDRLGYCWESYNDIADGIKISRSEAISIIIELTVKKLIRKMRKLRYDNSKVYSDNAYSLRVVKFIRRKPGKELQPCGNRTVTKNHNKCIYPSTITVPSAFIIPLIKSNVNSRRRNCDIFLI